MPIKGTEASPDSHRTHSHYQIPPSTLGPPCCCATFSRHHPTLPLADSAASLSLVRVKTGSLVSTPPPDHCRWAAMPRNASALSSTHRRPLPASQHCLPVSTEGILETTMTLSPFSTPHSDLGRPTTPGWTSSGEMPSSRCPCRCLGSPWTGLSTVVQGQWTWYTTFLLFLLENNPAVKTISTTLAHRPFRFQDTKPQFKLLYTKALLSFGKFHFSPLF
jgi:hypothetical protein